MQALHQRFDLRINQRFATADRDHRRVAFLRRGRGNPPAAECLSARWNIRESDRNRCRSDYRCAAARAAARWRISSSHEASGRRCRRRSCVVSARGNLISAGILTSVFLTVNGAGRNRANPVAAGSIDESHSRMALIPEKKETSRCSAPRRSRIATRTRRFGSSASFDYRPIPVNPAYEEIEGVDLFSKPGRDRRTGAHDHDLPRAGALDAVDRRDPGREPATDHHESRARKTKNWPPRPAAPGSKSSKAAPS